MRKISDKTALANYAENLERSRWTSRAIEDADISRYAYLRLRKDVFEPVINNRLRFDKSNKFFAMGSCFAREVETALTGLGINVVSAVEKGLPIRFGRGGYTNRYNTASMLNEIKFALGLQEFDRRAVVAADAERTKFLDLHSHPAGGYASFDEVLSRRDVLKTHFAHLTEADVFIVTLGLLETWFDTVTGQYINVSPAASELFELYPGRFEFHVLDHADNMANLEEIHALVKKVAPHIKIIVTTSPVPLRATFTERDVVTANTHSKSTLRSCAEQWCWLHPGEIEYFPSYEMAMNSNPDLVWKADRIHVQPIFVRQIMKSFVGHYIKDAAAELATTPDEVKEMEATIAESVAQRRSLGLSGTAEPQFVPGTASGNARQLLGAAKRAFGVQQYDTSIKAAEDLLRLYGDKEDARKHVLLGLQVACLASFRANDVKRGMAFYEKALAIQQPNWKLGLRVAKSLLRLDDKRRLNEVIEQLRQWAGSNPKRTIPLEELLERASGVRPLRGRERRKAAAE